MQMYLNIFQFCFMLNAQKWSLCRKDKLLLYLHGEACSALLFTTILTGSWRRKLSEEMFDLRKEEGKSISCLDDFIFVRLACCKLAERMRYDIYL